MKKLLCALVVLTLPILGVSYADAVRIFGWGMIPTTLSPEGIVIKATRCDVTKKHHKGIVHVLTLNKQDCYAIGGKPVKLTHRKH